MRRDLTYLISFVFISGLALTNYADAGLVAWWKLDEGSGTAALDSSGNTTVAGGTGKMYFDDIRLYRQVPVNK